MKSDLTRLAMITGDLAEQMDGYYDRFVEAFASHEISIDPVHWTDESIEWAEFDGVLFRSCWEYPADRDRFKALLAELETIALPVCNPLSVIRWNLHNSYLLELDAAGIPTPESVLIERGDCQSLSAIVDEQGWDDVVVKPAIGAMSSGIWRTSASTVAESEDRFTKLCSVSDVLVQKVVPEIVDGERSIVCFAGEYSHAWNSLTESDDITSFDRHDPTYDPSPSIKTQAIDSLETAIEIIGVDRGDIPYARVDYVHRDDSIVLMELELIEPYLGLERSTGAIDRFAAAVVTYFRDE